MIIINFIIK